MASTIQYRIATPMWDSASSEQHKSAKKAFHLPKLVKNAPLPAPQLTILEMLQFPMPSVSQKLTTPALATYFSAESPSFINDTLLDLIRQLPMPLKETIHRLESFLREQRLHSICPYFQ
ncbi:hypothetical protein BT96DRAFT_1008399 [Gymnopus androsaceus JB14]|uniref:Uncharacterized protein n=1 Tax=Gymnopus androsaceus JB14 TaxID=1447944 RepID=A0A6A4GFA7_9AGAR|nr:hypothetical protein BT96DRAFT_1008399 [Gymnopus androsaceus JB14]